MRIKKEYDNEFKINAVKLMGYSFSCHEPL